MYIYEEDDGSVFTTYLACVFHQFDTFKSSLATHFKSQFG